MAELQQANGLQHSKRKLILRLDDGSLIGPVESLLPGSTHGAPSAVLLDFEAACRTGKAGKTELERLDRLIKDFQTRVSGIHSIPRSELKQRNPYTQDVSSCSYGLFQGLDLASVWSRALSQPAASGCSLKQQQQQQ